MHPRTKKVSELEVLLGEMESLSRGARIYEGTTGAPGAVFLLARDRTAAKSAVKKEIREAILMNFDHINDLLDTNLAHTI